MGAATTNQPEANQSDAADDKRESSAHQTASSSTLAEGYATQSYFYVLTPFLFK